VTLALLPQPDAREGRDRLEILTALISAPSFDPLFRGDVITIPAGHPVYRWDCLAAGCGRSAQGRGDLCGAHEILWRKGRGEGGSRADFLQTAPLLGPGEGTEERPCRVCPGRPACQLTLRLCRHHQFSWYYHQGRHGRDADFGRWLAAQEPGAGHGRCRATATVSPGRDLGGRRPASRCPSRRKGPARPEHAQPPVTRGRRPGCRPAAGAGPVGGEERADHELAGLAG
jgi:hypothetical protein